MPTITNTRNNGSIVVSELVDSVGSTARTYTFPDTNIRDTLEVFNIGDNNLVVSVGTQTNVTISAYKSQKFDQSFTGFTLNSTSGHASFRVRASYKSEDEDDEQRLSTQLADIVKYDLGNYKRLDVEVDDTGRFQRALDDINSKGGGLLFIPEGSYVKDKSVMYSNITICGASKSNTTITLKTGATGVLFESIGTSGNYKKNIHFMNLTFNGGGVSQDLLSFDYMGFSSIFNCRFTNFAQNAIITKHTDGSVRADSLTISNCVFYDAPGGSATGIWCGDWGEYVNISNNSFIRVQFGVRVQDAANTSIINNLMINNGYAVYIWQTDNAINNGKTLIEGNRINHSYTTGIYANDMIRNADRGISIIGNHILLPNSSAIRLKGAYSSVINSNRIQMNLDTDNGIILENGTGISDYNIVTGNLITRGSLQNLTTGTNNLIVNNLANVPVS